MDLPKRLRSVSLLLLLASFGLVIGVICLRQFGILTESVTLRLPATFREGDVVSEGRDVDIVTLLPKDGIPAIFNPSFVSAEEADSQLDLDDLVIGVSLNGEHKAYGVAHLSSHEVVNDTLGGRPIAVTW